MSSLPDFKSGINERLQDICPNLDFSEAPPINQKRLVTFINHFLINVVDFLNRFSKHCSFKLLQFDEKINKIEAELCLLESKLNSIPELSDSKDVNVELPKLEELENTKSDDKEQERKSIPQVTETCVPDPPEVVATSTKEPENPELIKYRKMIQVGVPLEAVKIKMQIEGLDPSLLNS